MSQADQAGAMRDALAVPLQRVLPAAAGEFHLEVIATGAGPLVRLGLAAAPPPHLRRAVEACVGEILATPLPARVVYEIGRSL